MANFWCVIHLHGIMGLDICFDEHNSHDSLQVRLGAHNLLEPRVCRKCDLIMQKDVIIFCWIRFKCRKSLLTLGCCTKFLPVDPVFGKANEGNSYCGNNELTNGRTQKRTNARKHERTNDARTNSLRSKHSCTKRFSAFWPFVNWNKSKKSTKQRRAKPAGVSK